MNVQKSYIGNVMDIGYYNLLLLISGNKIMKEYIRDLKSDD